MNETEKKSRAYVAVIADDGTYRLGIAVEGESGYYKIRPESDAGMPFDSMDAANKVADAYNEGLGLSKVRASEIALSALRGPGVRRRGTR